MARRSPHLPPSSELWRTRWSVPKLGRHATDLNAHWVWYDIAVRMPERFALRAVSEDEVVGIWASNAKRPIVLVGETCYRPDYIEVDPQRRQGGLGLFLLAVIACRARELAAEGLVFGGLDTPAARALYMKAGAEATVPGGRRPARGLIPYCIRGEAFVSLCEYADAHEEEAEDDPGTSP